MSARVGGWESFTAGYAMREVYPREWRRRVYRARLSDQSYAAYASVQRARRRGRTPPPVARAARKARERVDERQRPRIGDAARPARAPRSPRRTTRRVVTGAPWGPASSTATLPAALT